MEITKIIALIIFIIILSIIYINNPIKKIEQFEDNDTDRLIVKDMENNPGKVLTSSDFISKEEIESGIKTYEITVFDKMTLRNKDVGIRLIPSGLITMWSGKISNIPVGWVLCDGKNGTPDLRGKFILGTGYGVDVNSVGGSKEIKLKESNLPPHSHSGITNVSGAHSHVYKDRYFTEAWGWIDNKLPGSRTGTDNDNRSFYIWDRTVAEGNHTHTFKTDNGRGVSENINIMPPYYVLAYIMKL